MTRGQGDDAEGKRLYQRIVAKLNFPAHDRLDLKCATSCLASAVSSPSLGDVQAVKRVGRYLRRAPVAWQGFSFHDSRPGELLCYTDADWASDKTSRRSTSGAVVTVGGGVLNCWTRRSKGVLHCQAGKASCSRPSCRGRDLLGSRVSLSRQTVRASLITRDAAATSLHQNMLV